MVLARRIIMNRSKIRRLLLLRRFQYKLRSLKRTKFCLRIYNRTIGKEYALEASIKKIIDFLNCSYHDIQDQNILICLSELITALEQLASNIHIYRVKNKSIPMNFIKPCTIAIRNLYHVARKTNPNLNCDDFWNQFGLVLIVLFNLT